MKLEIIEETPVGITQLKEELSKIQKGDNELSPRSQKLEEYVNQFTELSSEEYKKLIGELTKLDIPRLKELHIIKIADLLPVTVNDVKTILQGYALTVTNDNMKKIANVSSKFIPKKK